MSEQDGGRPGVGAARYGYSKLTDTWYRVTDWEDLGDGKIVAKQKDEIEESEVPDEWKGAIEWRIEEDSQP